jgi:TolA-binding protein
MIFSNIVFAENIKNNLLIIPFTNATEDPQYDSLKQGLPDLLATCFGAYRGFLNIVERYELDQMINEQSLGWENFIESQTIQSIGKLTNANYLLRGSIVKEANDIQIQILLFEISTTILKYSTSYKAEGEALIEKLCDGISMPIAEYLQSIQQEHKQIIIEENPDKQKLMIEGINYYYNGDYAKAFSSFMILIKKYPKEADAHYWLGKSFYAAGLDDYAGIQLSEFVKVFPDSPKMKNAILLLDDLKHN